MSKPAISAVKIIGIILFIIIIINIDKTELFSHLKKTNLGIVIAAYPLLFIMYVCRTARWQLLVQSLGVSPHWRTSWRVYNIGIFLGIITPAKVGELGRVAYLKKEGLSAGRGFIVAIADRLADVVVVGVLTLAAVRILFGQRLATITLILSVVTLIFLSILTTRSKKWCYINFQLSLKMFFWTLVGWCIYFTWAVLLARSVGIATDMSILVSVFTLTGVLALIPIAPSGLGTRDAALITLLAPFGIASEQALSLSILMFVSIVASSALGGWYWLKGRS